ncbi:MAG: hypothetical protein U0411_06425 [Thermodesulfovibrionales bacterium]
MVLTSYFLPKEYEAKCTVFIERSMINTIIKGIAVTPSLEEKLKVLSYTMSSRNLLLKVADDLGLPVNRKKQSEVEKVVSDFQKNTDITMKSENGLFIVSSGMRTPARPGLRQRPGAAVHRGERVGEEGGDLRREPLPHGAD